jgi:hypothetical protein
MSRGGFVREREIYSRFRYRGTHSRVLQQIIKKTKSNYADVRSYGIIVRKSDTSKIMTQLWKSASEALYDDDDDAEKIIDFFPFA